MTSTALTPDRYRALIDADTRRLLEVADRGVDAPVPPCPGWSVADLLDHVAHVYEHKVNVMAANAWPEEWPPPDYAGREPRGFLSEAAGHLFDEFDRHEPDEPTTTFGADSTVTFWMRRMALEVAVHRLDGELAHHAATPVDDALALDGIDEFLQVMLAGDWTGETEHPVDAVIAIEASGVRWVARLTGAEVTVPPPSPSSAEPPPFSAEPPPFSAEPPASSADPSATPAEPAEVTVTGDPEAVFLWLWGRAGDERVHIEGEPEVVTTLKARLVEAAQ